MARGDGRLKCKRCGWCCQNQLVSISTVEIQAITAYLKQKSFEEVEDHVTAILAYDGNLNPYDINFKKGLNTIQVFFDIGEIERFENDIILVKNHILHFLPDTQRCVFYNPLSSSCFIYPARPLTCKMFPYDVKDGKIVMVDETDECPGTGQGEPVNIQRLYMLSKTCEKLLYIDELTFWKFVHDEGLIRKTDSRTDHTNSINIINPYIQLGIIPNHPTMNIPIDNRK